MITGMYSAAAGMDLAAARHEVASRNLAFAQNPGFRRTGFQDPLRSNATSADSADQSPPSSGENRFSSLDAVDFTYGDLEFTGRTLDVALQGEGFLVVEGPAGPLYTRNGRLQVNAQGELVTVDGWPLKGLGGQLKLPPGVSAQNLKITTDGKLIAGETPLGQLEVVKFADNSRLERAGVTLFRAPEDLSSERAKVSVLQGMYEHSNVQPVTELVSIIVASRQYESAQLALRTIEQAVERHTRIRGG